VWLAATIRGVVAIARPVAYSFPPLTLCCVGLLLLLQSSRRRSTAIDRCRAFTDERQSKLRQKNGYASRRLFRSPFPFPFCKQQLMNKRNCVVDNDGAFFFLRFYYSYYLLGK
jgi:hypothetical protein